MPVTIGWPILPRTLRNVAAGLEKTRVGTAAPGRPSRAKLGGNQARHPRLITGPSQHHPAKMQNLKLSLGKRPHLISNRFNIAGSITIPPFTV